jgi:hypothetical protein
LKSDTAVKNSFQTQTKTNLHKISKSKDVENVVEGEMGMVIRLGYMKMGVILILERSSLSHVTLQTLGE